MKPSNDAVQENDTESVISVEPKEQHETKEVSMYKLFLVTVIHDFFNKKSLQKMTIVHHFLNEAIEKHEHSFFNEAIEKHDNCLLFLQLSHRKR